MKVISILQPYATLAVIGAKKIETRSWNTKYRGEILIHASRAWNNKMYDSIIKIGAESVLQNAGYKLTKINNGKIETNLPLGAIIGKVNIKDTFQMDEAMCQWMRDSNSENNREYGFGDWQNGRYGWLLSDAVQFETPIPAKGKLGLWELKRCNNVSGSGLVSQGYQILN